MFGQVGPLEILLVLGLALIIFGPKRLPELGRSAGRGFREFRGALSGDHDDDDDADEKKKHELEASAPPPPAAPVDAPKPVDRDVLGQPKD